MPGAQENKARTPIVAFIAVLPCLSVSRPELSVNPALPYFNQPDQALRDDLPPLFDQLVNNLTGRLNLADQADALTR
jgi:hypothetical protein